MSSVNKGPDWRIGYVLFCLIFAAWVIYLGLDNFDKVYGEYLQSVKRLQPDQIERIALQELADQCRTKEKRRGRFRAGGEKASATPEDNCISFPETVLEQQKIEVTERLLIEKKRFRRKLVVFYVSFVVFFLALPLYLLYLLLTFLAWVFKDLKFVK